MGLLEGLAALAVQQGHERRLAHVLHVHHSAALIGCDGAGGLVHHDVAAQTVNLVLGADVGDELQDFVWHHHVSEASLAADQPLPLSLLHLDPGVHEIERAGFKGHATPDHLPALLRLENAIDFDGEAEAVEQLRAQVSLLRVHRAHQHELGVVADGDALPLHVVAAHGGGVQQHVHQMVVEEVHLVDVQDPPVGGGDQTRFKVLLARLDGLLNIQGTHQAVFGSPNGQVNDADLAVGRGACPAGLLAPLAYFLRRARFAAVGTTRNHRNLGQQGGEGTHGGALGGAFLAPHQHAADPGVDGVEQQRAFHRRLADDGGEGEARVAPCGRLRHGNIYSANQRSTKTRASSLPTHRSRASSKARIFSGCRSVRFSSSSR